MMTHGAVVAREYGLPAVVGEPTPRGAYARVSKSTSMDPAVRSSCKTHRHLRNSPEGPDSSPSPPLMAPRV